MKAMDIYLGSRKESARKAAQARWEKQKNALTR